MKINEGAYFILELILYCAKQVKLNMYTGIAKKNHSGVVYSIISFSLAQFTEKILFPSI